MPSWNNRRLNAKTILPLYPRQVGTEQTFTVQDIDGKQAGTERFPLRSSGGDNRLESTSSVIPRAYPGRWTFGRRPGKGPDTQILLRVKADEQKV